MTKEQNTGEILRKGTVLFASFEDNKITAMIEIAEDVENNLPENAASMELSTRRWDNDKNSIVSDEDMFNRTKEALIKLGADPELVNSKKDTDDFSDIADSLMDNEVPVYFGQVRDEDRVSVNPIKSFIRPDVLTIAERKELDKTRPVILLTAFDDFDGVRFGAYGTVTMKNGDERIIRVSTLVKPSDDPNEEDTKYKLTYQRSAQAKMQKQIRDGIVPESRADELKEKIKIVTDKHRAAKVEELREVLDGRSILDLIENPEPIQVEIKYNAMDTGDPDKNYYFTAEVVDQYPVVEEDAE